MFRTNVLKYIFPSVAAMALLSCTRENEGALYDGESGFAFASNVLYAEVSSDDKGTLEIPVYRGVNGTAGAGSCVIQVRHRTAGRVNSCLGKTLILTMCSHWCGPRSLSHLIRARPWYA